MIEITDDYISTVSLSIHSTIYDFHKVKRFTLKAVELEKYTGTIAESIATTILDDLLLKKLSGVIHTNELITNDEFDYAFERRENFYVRIEQHLDSYLGSLLDYKKEFNEFLLLDDAESLIVTRWLTTHSRDSGNSTFYQNERSAFAGLQLI